MGEERERFNRMIVDLVGEERKRKGLKEEINLVWKVEESDGIIVVEGDPDPEVAAAAMMELFRRFKFKDKKELLEELDGIYSRQENRRFNEGITDPNEDW